MKKTKAVKPLVDIAMTILLFVLMAYQLTGPFAHEWAGAAMLVLFIAHHILNRQWFRGLGKGKYTAVRILLTAVDFLLLADMLFLMISGIRLSRYVFDFVPAFGSAATARLIHLAASHWGFVLMGLHLGLHWGMVVSRVRSRLGWKPSGLRQAILWIAAVLIGLYGGYVFGAYQFAQYMFLQVEFAFFDFSRPVLLFFADYLAILWLFVLLSYAAVRVMQTVRQRRTPAQNKAAE